MSTSEFLDRASRILPAVQARNISNLMTGFKNSGTIRNVDEYKKELQSLISTINDVDPKPSFKQVYATIWDLISSTAHNSMIRYMQNDLDAIYAHVNELGQKLDDSHILLMQNLIADLERALMDQENSIRRLEWLASAGNEFSLAIVNSFVSSSLLSVPRSTRDSESLYSTDRIYPSYSKTHLYSASVDEYSQMLTLPINKYEKIIPISVVLKDAESSYGTEVQSTVKNNISNIIDGLQDTFWIRNVYYQKAVSSVSTVLEFDFGVSRDINSIIIDGAATAPFVVYSIVGVSPSGYKQELLETEQEIDGWGKIHFNRCSVRSVKVYFSVKSYTKLDIYTDPNLHAHYISDISLKESERIEHTSRIAYSVLKSSNLAKAINVSEDISENINLYQYQFALDNIWFENTTYKDSGIFVSAPLSADNFGSCALQAIELSTEEVGSIEYGLVKIDTHPKHKEYRIPIPKLNQSEVVSERFIPTQRISSIYYNAGVLRFCPYINPSWSVGDSAPIRVYKNEEEIYIGTASGFDISIAPKDNSNQKDWVSSWLNAVDFSDFRYLPQKLWIKLRNPDSSAIYTVDYTIRVSDSRSVDNTVWLDKDKTISLLDGGRIYFKRNEVYDITSDIYLQIILRRNTANTSVGPILDEYAILGSVHEIQ